MRDQQRRQFRSEGRRGTQSGVHTVSNTEDFVIAADEDRVEVLIQVQGTESAIRVARAATTSSGADGTLVDAAPSAGKAGGDWVDDKHRGVVALRAVTAPVAVFVEVV
jgi:hypothetical protein